MAESRLDGKETKNAGVKGVFRPRGKGAHRNQFVVEAILDERFNHDEGCAELLIKWAGYDEIDDNSWEEKAKKVKEVPEMVAAFEAKRREAGLNCLPIETMPKSKDSPKRPLAKANTASSDEQPTKKYVHSPPTESSQLSNVLLSRHWKEGKCLLSEKRANCRGEVKQPKNFLYHCQCFHREEFAQAEKEVLAQSPGGSSIRSSEEPPPLVAWETSSNAHRRRHDSNAAETHDGSFSINSTDRNDEMTNENIESEGEESVELLEHEVDELSSDASGELSDDEYLELPYSDRHYIVETGRTDVQVLGVQEYNGEKVALAQYTDEEDPRRRFELVPTAVVARHAVLALIKFYEDRIKI